MSETESQKFQDILRRILTGHPDIRLAVLFGSLATGRVNADSDVDLAISTGRPLTAPEKMMLIEELAEATGRAVDLIDLHIVGQPLLGQILKQGRRILGSSHDYAEIIKRHLFEKADFMPYQRRILAQRRRAWIEM